MKTSWSYQAGRRLGGRRGEDRVKSGLPEPRASATAPATEDAVAEVSNAAGAIAPFVGTTQRALNRVTVTSALDYEAYVGYGRTGHDEPAAELSRRHDLCKVRSSICRARRHR
jgi:molybdopterin synthase catalytic subunit